ncbi:MAG: SulP family inorganic anion transporter [Chloroflexota bacterium]
MRALHSAIRFFTQPVQIARGYRREYLRRDLSAGLTVAVVMLPQAVAYAFVAGVPARMGLYTAVVGSIVGALWGSSNQVQTGPTNVPSMLVLSTLMGVEEPGAGRYLVAAGLLAVMGGGFQLIMGLARLGMLVNFVSDSVIVGFTAGAGTLIVVNQVEHLLRLPLHSAPELRETIPDILSHLPETHGPSLALGVGVVLIILASRRLDRRLPGTLIGMVVAAGAVWLLGLDARGVQVVGELPRSLPPLTGLSLFDVELAGTLLTGALAVAAIGLLETMSVARSISSQTGQRIDSNQEFVGQGLANIACGLFSGYVCSGSLSRSALNHRAGATTQLASVFAGLFVLVAALVLAPLAAYLPLPALAAALILIGWNLIDRDEIVRICEAGNSDRGIMALTIGATLLIPLQFAVLLGIGVSVMRYLRETSRPRVRAVKMSDDYSHFAPRPEEPSCPQLGVVEILGDLYFGAVSHIKDSIDEHLHQHPRQRFLLLRMYTVENCDISGIHALESIVETYRERGGDVYFVHVQAPVRAVMESTGFHVYVGTDHFLDPDEDVDYLFYRVIDPAVCIYECEVRAFGPCQNLPKQLYEADVEWREDVPLDDVPLVAADKLWRDLRGAEPPLIIDVREPREYDRAHIPEARLIRLPELLRDGDIPRDEPVVLVCRGGRRSRRAAAMLRQKGFDQVSALEGGMQAWERENLLEAVSHGQSGK